MAAAPPDLDRIDEWLFNTLDGILINTVAGNVESVITTITPFVITGLTLQFLFYGFAIFRGSIEAPLMDFLNRAVVIALVASFGTLGGLYQSEIASILVSLPDELSSSIFGRAKVATMIDDMLREASATADFITSNASYVDMVLAAIVALVVIVGASLLAAIGTIVLVMVKVASVMLASIGPIFILFILFDVTKKLFFSWFSMLLSYALLNLLFTMLFRILMDISMAVINAASDAIASGVTSLLSSAAAYLLVIIVSVYILWQLPNMAQGLTGGIGLSISGIRDLSKRAFRIR